ncbi:MAG: FAD-binding domain-containing protein, partial [Pseudomonadota bacterium]
MTLDLFPEAPPSDLATVEFLPTRAAGLARLEAFTSSAGRQYASKRNYDFGPENRSNVSALSPWIRHRLITEEEVLANVLRGHSLSTAEKYVQEVFWRTYFKGWLEHHPSAWSSYTEGLTKDLDAADRNTGIRSAYESALAAKTGIDCFDFWVNELIDKGYLHNHARMWFASIWIFTLKL